MGYWDPPPSRASSLYLEFAWLVCEKSNRKAMNRKWGNQKADHVKLAVAILDVPV